MAQSTPAPLYCAPARHATAPAPPAGSRWRLAKATLFGLIAWGATQSASAQIAGSVGIESDYRVRGYSLSARQPVATASLSYDDPSGSYISAEAIGSLTKVSNTPILLGAIGNVGYATRLSPGLSIDGGIVDSEYPNRLGGYSASRSTELYIGLLTHNLSARVYYSPNYYGPDNHILYGEIEGSVRLPFQLHLNGHVGLLGYLYAPEDGPRRATQYDWRLALSRRFGPFEVHAALSSGGPGKDYYNHSPRSRTTLTGGAAWLF
jgi:uncharacterized protein (TIGR02001 family)